MLVNRNELKAQLVRLSISGADLAKRLNISRQWLSCKMQGKASFTENEIKTLKDMFGETIFF